jgi:hypothetical protein
VALGLRRPGSTRAVAGRPNQALESDILLRPQTLTPHSAEPAELAKARPDPQTGSNLLDNDLCRPIRLTCPVGSRLAWTRG